MNECNCLCGSCKAAVFSGTPEPLKDPPYEQNNQGAFHGLYTVVFTARHTGPNSYL